MRPAKIVAIVVGALAAIVALGLLAGGSVLLWAHGTQRDADGYYTSRTERLESQTAAITSGGVDLMSDAGAWNPIDDLGTVRLRVEAVDESEIFVGIARQRDMDDYLAGVAHDELVEFDGSDGPEYRTIAGERRPTQPEAETFWVASTAGFGAQTLTWELDAGEWAAIVMNVDGGSGIAVEADAGIRTGWLLPIGIGLLGAALVSLAVAIALLIWGARPDRTAITSAAAATPPPTMPVGAVPPPPARYPLTLDGRLDPGLSRWMWLVKWFLVIPHLIVLVLLWVTFAVLTFVAGVAILFTGRYPRSIFDFNVGVLRWTWRVTFYAFTLGSDEYPPFSLDSRPDDPAALAVQYPERLSRPLVLVKWWLLALPHYIVISVFGGGMTWWVWGSVGENGGQVVIGGGLIGFLVLVSAVVLTFTRHYPQALFDFVMGMQRWIYRVVAYATLMTDEYPPFRLDNGGSDPGHDAAALPPPPVPPAPVEDRVPVGM